MVYLHVVSVSQLFPVWCSKAQTFRIQYQILPQKSRMNVTRLATVYAAAITCGGKSVQSNVDKNTLFKDKKRTCKEIVLGHMTKRGEPGMSVCISVNGKNVWSQGFGYADLENNVPCTPKTVMRIGSISKPITMTSVAKLWQDGKLDIDKSVQEYVPEFPKKVIDNKEVKLTTRMLLSHVSGIRHYKEEEENDKTVYPEMNSMKKYKDVKEALDMFKDEPLLHKPGSEFSYTTHGFTLISAVVESAAGENFLLHLRKMFHDLGLDNTYPDEHTPLIYNRARQYERTERGIIVNTPYVDNSYKWAGGGLISSAEDIIKFGNIMLYCYQNDGQNSTILPGYLKSSTVKEMWSPIVSTEKNCTGVPKNKFYGLGWAVCPEKESYGCDRLDKFEAFHRGGPVGGSGVLLIRPTSSKLKIVEQSDIKGVNPQPQGVVVAILTNINGINLTALARELAYVVLS